MEGEGSVKIRKLGGGEECGWGCHGLNLEVGWVGFCLQGCAGYASGYERGVLILGETSRGSGLFRADLCQRLYGYI